MVAPGLIHHHIASEAAVNDLTILSLKVILLKQLLTRKLPLQHLNWNQKLQYFAYVEFVPCMNLDLEGLSEVNLRLEHFIVVELVPSLEVKVCCLQLHARYLVVSDAQLLAHVGPLVEVWLGHLIILQFEPHPDSVEVYVIHCKVTAFEFWVV